MKVLFLTNNAISESLIKWLKEEFGEKVESVNGKISRRTIEGYKPDFLISYNYMHIIKKDVLGIMKNRAINLHISLLPWNKGANPNIWSFLKDTPKGVTVHIIDEGVDTGAILLQKELYFCEEKETLSSSYESLNKELQELFISNWDRVKNMEIVPSPQPQGGNVHYKKDFERIRHILGEEGWDIRVSELKRRYNELKNEKH